MPSTTGAGWLRAHLCGRWAWPGKTSTSRVRKLATYLPIRPTTSPPDASRSPAQRARRLSSFNYYVLVASEPLVQPHGCARHPASAGPARGLISTAGQFFSAMCWTGRLAANSRSSTRGYHLWWPLREGVDSVRMLLGRRPLQRPCVPPGGATRAARWPPPGRLRDGTWQIFVAEGEALATARAAPPGCSCPFAADSPAWARLRRGRCVPHLSRLTVAPGFRAVRSGRSGLRVALLDDGQASARASPSGAGRHGRMDTSESGRPIGHAGGGRQVRRPRLAFDEVVTW